MNDERYTLEETTVRFARSKLWVALSIVPSLAMLAIGLKIGVLFFLFPLPVVVGFLVKGAQITRVVASREGLRVGERLVPRSALAAALVRHERGTTYVELRGDREIDVEVANNVEADALVRALALDAASTTLEVPIDLAPNPFAMAAILVGVISLAVGLAFAGVPALALLACFLATVMVFTMGRASLRIGADGIVFRPQLGASRFVSHDRIVSVDVDGTSLLVRESNGRETKINMRGQRALEDQSRAIARRIVQARQAHRESRASPELAIALDRGSRTTREWIAELRKVGAGAASTFRTIGVAREQLVAIIESTSASAKDRVAALVALRGGLDVDEAKRVRVAVDRIAAPDVRVHLARVLDARNDEELEAVLAAGRS